MTKTAQTSPAYSISSRGYILFCSPASGVIVQNAQTVQITCPVCEVNDTYNLMSLLYNVLLTLQTSKGMRTYTEVV